jgi:hypothetical protein
LTQLFDLRPIGDLQFAEDAGHIVLHRLHAEHQPLRDDGPKIADSSLWPRK